MARSVMSTRSESTDTSQHEDNMERKALLNNGNIHHVKIIKKYRINKKKLRR